MYPQHGGSLCEPRVAGVPLSFKKKHDSKHIKRGQWLLHPYGGSSELFTQQVLEMLLKCSEGFWLPLLRLDTLCNFVYNCRVLWSAELQCNEAQVTLEMKFRSAGAK